MKKKITKTPLDSYFQAYSKKHQSRQNQLMHWFGIPLIVFSVLGVLSTVSLGSFCSLSTLAVIVLGVWYSWLDWRIGVSFTGLLLGLSWLAGLFPLSFLIGAFVVGWIFQTIGHAVYEKNRPAFFESLEHLFIGPLWIYAKLF